MNPSACLHFTLLIPGFSKKQVWHFIAFYFDLSLPPLQNLLLSEKQSQEALPVSQVVLVPALMSPGSVRCHPIPRCRGERLVALPAAEPLTQHKKAAWKLKFPLLLNSPGDVDWPCLTDTGHSEDFVWVLSAPLLLLSAPGATSQSQVPFN